MRRQLIFRLARLLVYIGGAASGLLMFKSVLWPDAATVSMLHTNAVMCAICLTLDLYDRIARPYETADQLLTPEKR